MFIEKDVHVPLAPERWGREGRRDKNSKLAKAVRAFMMIVIESNQVAASVEKGKLKQNICM